MNGELMGEDAAAAQEGEEHVSTVVLCIYLQLPSCYSVILLLLKLLLDGNWRDCGASGYPHDRVLSGLYLKHSLLSPTLGSQLGSRT